jgi:two-component system nitrogen regulation response regulator GlnG
MRELEKLVEEALPALLSALIDAERGHLYRAVVAQIERPLLAAVLAASRGNQLEAARVLGINRNTLRKRLRLLGLDRPRLAEGTRTRSLRRQLPNEAAPSAAS